MRINQFATPRDGIIVGGVSVTAPAEAGGADFKHQRTYRNGLMHAPVTGCASRAH
ncbi:hypothetical protein [Streptomyces sp. NPDC002785]|uniref:hypothetical protein n=1 Tax=Streptomyces sp. NPDC002785 TaxID=3154543 RepID=UPI00331BF323